MALERLGLVVEHVLDQVADDVITAERPEVGLLEHRQELVALLGLLEGVLDLPVVVGQERGLLLEGGLVVLDGRGRLPVLRELVGHLVPQRGVVGPELGRLHELGPGLLALAGRLVVVGQRLEELDRVRAWP